jgi:hypothetical protein
MIAQSKATVAAATTGLLVGAVMVSTPAVCVDASPATLAFLQYLIGICFLAGPIFLIPTSGYPQMW